jgi:predicted nucleic acid-binding Zn ribbon protein
VSLTDDHHHCKICGKVVESSETFCSPACRAKREETVRSGRRLQLVMYGAMALFFVVLILELRV